MKIIKRNLTLFLIILVAIVLVVSFYQFKISRKEYITDKNENDVNACEQYFKQEYMGKKVEQFFEASKDNLNVIQINFEALRNEKKIGGKVILGIKDVEKNVIISEDIIYYNMIREKPNYLFRFNKQSNSEGKTYCLYLDYETDKEESPFTVKYNTNKFKKNTKLTIDGEEIDGELAFIEYYKNERITIFFCLVSVVVSIIILLISINILLRKNISIERIFLLSVPIICLLFFIFMPIFRNHDELYHWQRIYDISEGNLITKKNNEVDYTSAYIPSNVIYILEDYDFSKLRYINIFNLLDAKLDDQKRDYADLETTAIYSPIQYAPQVLGVIITRLVSDTPIIIAYGARFANLVFSLIVLYFAIKLMPFGKKLLLIPMFIPIAIEGFSSMSPDAMTISICFLFIAYVFNIAYNKEKKVKIKEVTILLFLSVLIALCKIVYLPIIGLVLIIPKEKFKSQKSKTKSVTLIFAISILLNLVWLLIASTYLATYRGGDSKLQVINILCHPFEYIKILLYTINVKGFNYFESLFGGQLGWGESVRLNFITPFSLFIIYFVMSIIDNEIKNKLNKFQKVIIILIILAISVLIFTSLYVQWTCIGEEIIAGVQGRYFLPFLPLIFILIGNSIRVKSLYKEENIVKFASITNLILQIYVMMSLVIVHI